MNALTNLVPRLRVESEIARFNAAVPKGSGVALTVGGSRVKSTTAGPAFALHGVACVRVLGVAGSVPLKSITLVPFRAYVRIRRTGGRKTAWLEGWWDNKEHMLEELEERKSRRDVVAIEWALVRPE